MPFQVEGAGGVRRGVNILGTVRGTTDPDRWIVVTAHYDHLGVRDDAVFNGADDNASGVAGLLALAEVFARARPRHSLLFIAFDAEELGLRGARAFIADPPIPLGSVALNVNLDMVGRNAAGELYVAGPAHNPALEPLIDQVAASAPVTLIKGHDRPGGRPSDDWTTASDHGPFHLAGIAFLYFGVEDHPDYHRATDDFERIDGSFHARAVETVRRVIAAADARR
jgi:Zn-dependent M28 family amino/carboxypeptidase